MGSKFKEIAKVGTTGVLSSVIDITVLFVCFEAAQMILAAAAFLGSCSGAVFNFFVNRRWSFKKTTPVEKKEVIGFAAVAFGTAHLISVLVSTLASGFELSVGASKGLAAVIVFVFWSYPAQSQFVFKSSKG